MSKRTCSIDGCDGAVKARGWCNRHYRLWQRNGSTEDGKRRQYASTEESFAARTEWRGDCLVWTGGRSHDYGCISYGGKMRPAHVYAWERENGPVPAGHEVDHICWNKLCVNVRHLRIATDSENLSNRSGTDRGRKHQLPRNVTRMRDKYQVRVTKAGVHHNLGTYATVEEAAAVAKAARADLFGEYAGRG